MGLGRLTGKRAIVTGAASGIGEAVAKMFLDEGAQVLAADLSSDALTSAFAGTQAELIAKDVTDDDAPDAIVGAAVSAFGGLDILINNAGISGMIPLDGHPDAEWNRMMEVNMTAVFRLTRAAIPHLKESGAGRIVNTGSVMSEFAAAGLGAYAASKHAVAGFTKALATEFGEFGITANFIQPGAILTGITRPTFDQLPEFRDFWVNKAAMKRLGEPDDVAPLVVFLASDEARFISGQGVYVDGGAMQQP
ncbi:MAG: SDR family NAD(P)-dependent oxidoreductase [Pseudomonadota bacterium]